MAADDEPRGSDPPEAVSAPTGLHDLDGVPRRRISGGLVLLFAVATGVSVANNYLAQPLLDTIRVDFGVPSAVAGLVVTAAQVGYAAGLVLLLPLGDLLERRRLVTVLAVCTAAFLILEGVAPSVGLLMLAAALVGLTSTTAQILVPFAASLARDDERGRVVGTVMSGLLLGILLARTASGLVAEVAGWRTVYFIAAGLMLVLAGLLRWRLPRYQEDVHLAYPRLLASTLGIARDQPILRLRALYGALAFAAFGVVWTSLAFLLAGPHYGYSEGIIGLFGLIGAAGAAVAIAAGRLADRGWSRRVTGATSLIMVVSYLLIWLGGAGRVWPLIAGIVLLDVGSNGLHITNQSEIYRLDPAARSRINAVYMTSCFVGAAVGSSTSAFAYARWGWTGVSLLGAAFGLASTLLWAGNHRRSQPPSTGAVR
jgi:predicted MFS family arabinose efflux permease